MADYINDQPPWMEEDEQDLGMWTTREGDQIRILDMTDSHLVNALRLMERKNFIPTDEFSEFLCSGTPNGEAAKDAWDEALDEVMGKTPSEKMSELAEEAKRRNLEWKQ